MLVFSCSDWTHMKVGFKSLLSETGAKHNTCQIRDNGTQLWTVAPPFLSDCWLQSLQVQRQTGVGGGSFIRC